MTQQAGRRMTIRGMVLPADWDKDGQVLQVLIDTPEENEFFVEPNVKGRELARLIHQHVEVCGDVTVSAGGDVRLTVASYRRLGQNG